MSQYPQSKYYDVNDKGKWYVFNPNEEYVELRYEPGEFSPFIETIKNGESVYCFGYYDAIKNRKWLCVSHNGNIGYIPRYYCKR